MPERRDPYRILQVHREAELDVIRAAYRVLARKLHPDGRIDSPLDAAGERRMTDLNWAYALLRNAEARAAFDVGRRYRAPAAPAGARRHRAARPDVDYDPGEVRLDFGRDKGW